MHTDSALRRVRKRGFLCEQLLDGGGQEHLGEHLGAREFASFAPGLQDLPDRLFRGTGVLSFHALHMTAKAMIESL